jgi:hypothetical protein
MACVVSTYRSESRPGGFDFAGANSIGFRFLSTLRSAALRFARQRLRYAAREIPLGQLERIDASDPEKGRELRELFGLPGRHSS